MITIKSKEEIAILREGGKRHALILRHLASYVRPGVHSRELENIARKMIEEGGDKSAFLDYQPRGATRPYPAALCLSVNDEVVHGIPNEDDKILKDGDIVSLDLGLVHRGLITDMAITVPVGNISMPAKKLLAETERALYAGIKMVKAGNTVNDISKSIEKVAIANDFGVVEELAGHGVGYAVHEDPYVPNYASKKKSPILKAGMVLAIEPMFNLGSKQVYLTNDGYTYKTVDGMPSAHFEHTILVTENGSEILTK